MPVDLEVTPSGPRELVIRRLLRAPPAAVWRCWSEPTLLRQWFCPKPWFVSEAVMELRAGGRFDTTMCGPDGEVMPNRGQFLEVVPGRRLVFTDAYVGDWQPGEEHMMTGFVELEPHPEGTVMTWGARHWSDAATQSHLEMGFHAGWGAAAAQLEELAGGLGAG